MLCLRAVFNFFFSFRALEWTTFGFLLCCCPLLRFCLSFFFSRLVVGVDEREG